MASDESENSWFKDMNNLADNLGDNESMDIDESEGRTLKESLSSEAYTKYVKSLEDPHWVVYTRPDALYSRLGLQLECYPISKSTPSAYRNLLDQVSNTLNPKITKDLS